MFLKNCGGWKSHCLLIQKSLLCLKKQKQTPVTGCSGEFHVWSLLLSSHSAPQRQEVRVQQLDQTTHKSSSSSHDVSGLRNRNSNSRDAADGSVTQVEARLPSDDTTKDAAVMNVNVTEACASHLADGYYQLLQEERYTRTLYLSVPRSLTHTHAHVHVYTHAHTLTLTSLKEVMPITSLCNRERGWCLSQQMLRLLENTSNQRLQVNLPQPVSTISFSLAPHWLTCPAIRVLRRTTTTS